MTASTSLRGLYQFLPTPFEVENACDTVFKSVNVHGGPLGVVIYESTFNYMGI